MSLKTTAVAALAAAAMAPAALPIEAAAAPTQPTSTLNTTAAAEQGSPWDWGQDKATTKLLLEGKAASAKYRDPAKAVADGYVPGPVDAGVCVKRSGGTRGYHYSNLQVMQSPWDVKKPAVLVYQPIGAHGALRLVAVEWFSLDRDQDPSTTQDRPYFGSQPFIGPVAGIPNVPVHYYAIAWVWQDNPWGVFADVNPTGIC